MTSSFCTLRVTSSGRRSSLRSLGRDERRAWVPWLTRERGARPRLLLSSSGRFQGRQERGSFEGFLQGFFGAEESRGRKKHSVEGPRHGNDWEFWMIPPQMCDQFQAFYVRHDDISEE